MAKFVSKCPNQVIGKIPNRVQIIDGIVVPQAGEHIRFNNGEYETNSKQDIAFLRGHQLFGLSITEVEEVKVEVKDEKAVSK